MSKQIKELIAGDFSRRFAAVNDAVIIECGGLNSQEAFAFRKAIRSSGATVNFVKNTMARRAFEERGITLESTCFGGHTAIVHSHDNAVGCSKVVADWRKKNKKEMPFKGGILGGKPLNARDAEKLVHMPGTQEVKQMLVSAIAGPLTAMVNITNNVLSGVPQVLQAIHDKKQKEGV